VRKITQYLLAGCSVLLLVVVIAVCLIPFLVDPNDYKTDIAALIKNKVGRDVAFVGDITVSVFPWVGLKTEKMVISDRLGSQKLPFISVAKSDINVKLLPLLSQKIEVSTIALEGLTLNLVKDKQGVSNWADLVAPNPVSPSNAAATAVKPDTKNIQPQSALAALTVGGIAINNAQVNWDNQQTGERLELKNIHFTVDKFTFGEPVKIDLAMAASGKELKFPGSVKLTSDLRVDEKLDNFVFSDSHLEWLDAKKLASGQSLAITITTTNTAVNVTQQTLKFSGLQLQSGDLKFAAEITGEQFLDKPSFQGTVVATPFNPGIVLKQWDIALPTMSDAKALTNLGMSFHFQANPDQVELTNMDVTLDNSHGTGSVTIKDFALPAVVFDVVVDAIDVDRYLAPPEKSSKPLVSPGMAIAAGTFSLPLDWLRKLDAEGKLVLGNMTFNRMTLQDLHLTLSSKKGIVKVEQTAKQFYQGSYSGNLSVDTRAEKSTLALDETFTNTHLEPFLKAIKGNANMGGVVTLSTQLHGQGSKLKEIKSNLTGKVDFFLKDGFIKGFNLQKMVENGKKLVKSGALPVDSQPLDSQHDQTNFSEISGTATINKGLLQNNDLIANTAKLRSTGRGSVNLNTEGVDYNILIKLLKAAATTTTPEQVHDTPIGIHLGGTFSKPTYTLDAAALLTDKNKAKIEHFLDKNKVKIDKLMDKLDKKLAPGVGDLLKKIF
jgi:AsmA protein